MLSVNESDEAAARNDPNTMNKKSIFAVLLKVIYPNFDDSGAGVKGNNTMRFKLRCMIDSEQHDVSSALFPESC